MVMAKITDDKSIAIKIKKHIRLEIQAMWLPSLMSSFVMTFIWWGSWQKSARVTEMKGGK